MAKNSVFDWDSTAASNTDIASIPIDGAVTTPSQVDNIIREVMAQGGEFVDDLGGVNTVGGTANAITITAKSGYTALATGLMLSFKASNTNTGATTVNVNSIGAKAIRKFIGAEAALVAGDIIANGIYQLVYDAAANSAAGAWILLNPSPTTGTFTPVVAGGSVAGSGTYSTQVGTYTRIGNRVFFDIQLAWSGHTGTGQMTITGLPFASLRETVFSAMASGAITYTDMINAKSIPSVNATTIYMHTMSSGNQASLAMDAGASLEISGQYAV